MKKIKHLKFQNPKRSNLDFDLVSLESLFAKDTVSNLTNPHIIEFFNILLFTEGKGYHTINYKDHSYKKGTLFTIRKDQAHRFFVNPNAKGYMLLFTEEFLTSHFGKDEVLRGFQLFNELLISPKLDLNMSDYKEIKKSIEIIDIECNNYEDEFSGSIIRSELHVLLVKLFRIKTKNYNNLLKQTYYEEFLQFQKLIERDFSKTRKVIDYANMMNCSSKTLNNICRAILNKPAKALIDEIVILHIKRLLQNTSVTIKEIAYKSGFAEPTNMFRYFKKHTNSSPKSFRRINK